MAFWVPGRKRGQSSDEHMAGSAQFNRGASAAGRDGPGLGPTLAEAPRATAAACLVSGFQTTAGAAAEGAAGTPAEAAPAEETEADKAALPPAGGAGLEEAWTEADAAEAGDGDGSQEEKETEAAAPQVSV